MTRAAPAPFSATMRIYWEDTDAAGIVFYANYLKFFERARTEWLRGLGFGQEQLRTGTGIAFVVHLGQASLEIAQEARRAGDLLADGTIRIGCVELGTFRPCRIPNEIRLSIHR
jgi:acyl-CoA thioester hydrolase